MRIAVHPVTDDERRRTLEAALVACKGADRSSRELDAGIALAVFPSLAELTSIEAGVWRQADGTHARALRYSSSREAAASIVPPGCWIESGPGRPRVAGPAGEWDGSHEVRAIALCIAALSARIGEANK